MRRTQVVAMALLAILVVVAGLGWLRSAAPARGAASPMHATSASCAHLQQAVHDRELVDADGQPVLAERFPSQPFTLLYFSANWCAPCHAVTPILVKFYQDAGAARMFNILMVSEDVSQDELTMYARTTHMPWAIAKLNSDLAASLEHDYASDSIPDLVLVDATGAVLADSMQGDRGPQSVLDQFAAIQSDLQSRPQRQRGR